MRAVPVLILLAGGFLVSKSETVQVERPADKGPSSRRCKIELENALPFPMHPVKRTVANCENLALHDENIGQYLADLPLNITVLKLSHNFLREVNLQVFSDFRQLEVLDLSDNSINAVKGNFRNIPASVTFMDYSENRLTEINPNMIPARAQKLSFTKNVIEQIVEGSFINAQDLEILDLSRNRLRTMYQENNGILYAQRLRLLNLSRNGLDVYFNNPERPKVVFSALISLEVLDLTYNHIDLISADELKSMGKLKHLNLSHNTLPSMTAMTLNETAASAIGKTSRWALSGAGLKSLETLDLSYNHIRTIELDLLESLDRLNSVDLSNNLYDCRGDLYFAVYYLTNKHEELNITLENSAGLRNYRCFTPNELANRDIFTFPCTGYCMEEFIMAQMKHNKQEPSSGGSNDPQPVHPGVIIAIIGAIMLVAAALAWLALWAHRNGWIHRHCRRFRQF